MEMLICCVDCPYPLNSGGNQASYNMIDYLRKFHTITLLCLNGKVDDIATLRKLWMDVHVIVSNTYEEVKEPFTVKKLVRKVYHAINGNKQSNNTLQRLQRERMLLYSNNFFSFSPRYVSLLSEVLAGKNFDLVQIEFAELLGIVYGLPDFVKKVFVHHEIRFLRLEQEKNTIADTTQYEDILIKAVKDQEVSLLSAYDYVITLEEDDRNFLLPCLPEKKIYNSPFAIEVPAKRSTPDPVNAQQKVVFLGGENHYPNLDAIAWFTEHVWPDVLKEDPRLNLYVIGNWSKSTILYFKKVPNLVFTGFVKDLQAIFDGAIMVVPIRIGSGIRAKILDAIAYSVPIVTTSTGKGGLPLYNRKECIVADTKEDFTSGVLQLLHDEELRTNLADNALKAVSMQYTKEVCGNLRNSIYKDIERTADSIRAVSGQTVL